MASKKNIRKKVAAYNETNSNKEAITDYVFAIDKQQVIYYIAFSPMFMFFLVGLLAIFWEGLSKGGVFFLGIIEGIYLFIFVVSLLFYLRGEKNN